MIAVTRPYLDAYVADYSAGAGTLADGIVGTSTTNTQLFVSGNPDRGGEIAPVLALKFDKVALVSMIRLYGGNIDFNWFPGQITDATVEIGGQSVHLTTIPAEGMTAFGWAFDDVLDLTGTPLADIPTDTVVVRDIGYPASTSNQCCISEVEVFGGAVAIDVIIDVKPGSKNDVVGGQQDFKVAVLSTTDFDAAALLDTSTLTLGHTGDKASLISCQKDKDVNKDGLMEVCCSFSMELTGLTEADEIVHLKGKTFDGLSVVGIRHIEHRGVVPTDWSVNGAVMPYQCASAVRRWAGTPTAHPS